MAEKGIDASHPVYTHKVVFLGDLSTGKTSIINRFVYGNFSPVHNATIGVDLISKTVGLDNYQIRFQLWDTAGQERFRAIIPSYIRESSVCIVVFDMTNVPSFTAVDRWVKDIREARGNDAVIMLSGNKCDLEEERAVTTQQGQSKAEELKIMYFETSAKDGTNIQKMFVKAAKVLPQAQEIPDEVSKLGKTIHVTPQNAQQQAKSSSSCCS